MSQMFGHVLQEDPGKMLAIMTPAVALGNAMAIIFAGLLDRLGKAVPSLSGEGNILRGNREAQDALSEREGISSPITDLSVFAAGMAVAGIYLGFGQLIQKFVPSVHAYAWMILLMVVSKAAGILPAEVERSCALWYQFFVKNFATVLLAGLGIGLISLKPVLEALNGTYLLIVLVVVIGAILGSALMGYILGFYPIEAAITGGLCMANMGGSGDIATLMACNRMNLMPFAAVSSRLGGALMLILGSFLLPFLAR